MPSQTAPPWCRWGAGRSAVLIVAPHGGRRAADAGAPPPAATTKVNDLHTAALAGELAEALQASYVINAVLDRNQLDLNRLSQVCTRAPWFLALLEHLVGDILLRHARAEVLVVHGWNVLQAKCDVGVGRRLADAGDAVAHAAELTASADYVAGRLTRLRERCAERGIDAPWGERYPARHHNNALQLFRRAPLPRTPSARLAAWSSAGRVDAVQLELGVPLRWPGTQRDAFLQATVTAFDGAGGPLRSGPRPARARPSGAGALQLYDPGTGIGLAARVDRAGARGPVSGRLLLFVGDDRVALYTGEDPPGAAGAGAGPHFTQGPDGFRLTFEGVLLATEDGRLYVDLEQALAAARLCAVRLDVRFRPTEAAGFGTVDGGLEVDGASYRLDTCAFAHEPFPQRTAGAWRSHVAVLAAFDAHRAVRAHHQFPGGGTISAVAGAEAGGEPVREVAICFDRDRHTPRRISLAAADGSTVCAEPRARMSVLRPLAERGRARLTFGVARVVHGDREGFGFYEYARALAPCET